MKSIYEDDAQSVLVRTLKQLRAHQTIETDNEGTTFVWDFESISDVWAACEAIETVSNLHCEV
jgi:hypothetical protein